MNKKKITDEKLISEILEKSGLVGERLEELKAKTMVIAGLSVVLKSSATSGNYYTYVGTATGCELRTYVEKHEADGKEEWEAKEYLIVHYRGGAWAARHSTVNSNSANFQEVSRMLNGGYYGENDRIEELEKKAYAIVLIEKDGKGGYVVHDEPVVYAGEEAAQ